MMLSVCILHTFFDAFASFNHNSVAGSRVPDHIRSALYTDVVQVDAWIVDGRYW